MCACRNRKHLPHTESKVNHITGWSAAIASMLTCYKKVYMWKWGGFGASKHLSSQRYTSLIRVSKVMKKAGGVCGSRVCLSLNQPFHRLHNSSCQNQAITTTIKWPEKKKKKKKDTKHTLSLWLNAGRQETSKQINKSAFRNEKAHTQKWRFQSLFIFFSWGGPPRIYNELVGQRGRKKEQINL